MRSKGPGLKLPFNRRNYKGSSTILKLNCKGQEESLEARSKTYKVSRMPITRPERNFKLKSRNSPEKTTSSRTLSKS